MSQREKSTISGRVKGWREELEKRVIVICTFLVCMFESFSCSPS